MKNLWWRVRHFFEKMFGLGYTKEIKGILNRTSFLIKKSKWSYKTWANIIECDEKMVRKMVHKRIIVSYSTLKKIAHYSGVDVHWILTGKQK